ncbi:MAG: macrolide transporter ATP-binding/permease protein, partial [Verrucomicrobiales bacterium]|nr:macrolide transporter ATP-binding/permease protein [Verrucomicrobiales bacterium]
MIRILYLRLRALFQTEKLDARMDEEMRSHIELQTHENIQAGMRPDEARYAALRQFGRVESIKVVCREQRGTHWLENLIQDIRFGLRMLRKNPGFTAVAVMTLALGIGVNCSVFSVMNAILLRPLPYPEPNQLVQVMKNWKPSWRDQAELSSDFGVKELSALQKEPNLPLAIAAYAGHEANLSGGEQPERVSCGGVTPSFLQMLGINPAVGRNFFPAEDRTVDSHLVILGYPLWQHRFSGDAQVIGKTVLLNDKGCRVIGVLPADSKLPQKFDLLIPLEFSEELLKPKHMAPFPRILGRIPDGMNREKAQRRLTEIYAATSPPEEQGRIVLRGFHEQLVSSVKPSLWIFQGAVIMVLLIACVNVTNLLLARASSRRKEMAVRSALGAGRLRIMRQLLTESFLISVLGGILGLFLSLGARHALEVLTTKLPTTEGVSIDSRMLGFTLAISLLSGVFLGLAPAFSLMRLSAGDSPKEAARSITSGINTHRLRSLLVVSEVSLSIVLLLGAGLLIKSFIRLRGVNPGFRSDHMLSLTVDLNPPRYPDPRSQADYFDTLITRLQSLPGVQAIAADATLPFGNWALSSGLEIEGQTLRGNPTVFIGIVNADYFKTLGISQIRGQPLTDRDRAGKAGVVVVNERFVRRYFPSEDPLGKRIQTWGDEWKTIVGVVSDVRLAGLEQPPEPIVYHSFLQTGVGIMSLAVKTAGEPMKLSGAVKSCAMEIDKGQPVFSLVTMEQRLKDSIEPKRINVILLGLFATLAGGLAALGIYGVISFLVNQRTHEIGIRIALGASPRSVQRMILERGLVLVLPGIMLGLLGGIGLTRAIASQLYGVPPTDPLTFCAVSLGVILTALLASSFP